MPFSQKTRFTATNNTHNILTRKTDNVCFKNFYKSTYSVAGDPLSDASLNELFIDILDMSISQDMPPSLRANGVVWYLWPECVTREKLQPEIHLVNNKRAPFDGKRINFTNDLTGPEVSRRFNHGHWSAIADNHVAMFVDIPYFNKVLESLKKSQYTNYFGPVDRQDSGKPGGPYQLYIQIGNYPYVIELDTVSYDFSLSPPLCRSATALEPSREACECVSKVSTSTSSP